MKPMITTALAALLLTGCSREEPHPAHPPQQSAPQPASLAVPAFDSQRAFAQLLAQTSFGPRDPGSAGHARCLAYLLTTLRGLADTVRLQEFSHPGYDRERLDLTNIIASFQPEAPARILLLAHWDSRPRADRDPDPRKRNQPILGANDGASGVAVLLELARLLREQRAPVGIDLLFVDGEDYGREGDQELYLLGARYFASHRPAGYAPRFGILLDMIGDAYLEIPQEQNSVRFAPDIVKLVWDTARTLGITQFINVPGEEIMDDHLPLNDAGIKTIDLIDFAYPDQSNRYWHTSQDTPEHCSAESLGAVGSVLTHLLYTQVP